MHSPPGPADLLEQIGHRLGDHDVARGHGQPAAHARAARASAPPVASTARRARTRPPLGLGDDIAAVAARRDATGVRSKTSTPALAHPVARARGRGAPAARSPRPDRRRRRGRSARRSGAGPLGRVSSTQASGSPSSRAGPQRPAPRRRPRRARSRPAGSRPGRYQASTPCSRQKLADLGRPSAAPRARPRSPASSPNRSRSVGRLNQSPLTKPPLRPLGPSPQTAGLEQHDPRLRLEPLEVPGRPQPRVAAADDDDVGACARRRAAGAASTGARLVEPVAVRVVALRHRPQCRDAAARSDDGRLDRWRPRLRARCGARSARAGRCAARRPGSRRVQSPSGPSSQELVLSASERSRTSTSSARDLRSSKIGVDQLDPVVEVARHQVGGADVDARRLAVALERVDPRVLEEAPDDRAHRRCSPRRPARRGAGRRSRGR